MFHDLKPYPVMKDSGIASLGKIPEHWRVIRTGRLFLEVVDTGHPDLELLSIDRFRGVIRQRETGRKERAPEDRSAYKHIRQGELAYNLMNAFMGSIGVSSFEGILSPAYAVGRPIHPLNAWYYHYLYRTPIYMGEFDRWSYGIMYERNRLYFDRFKIIPVPYPPVDEQDRIVAFIKQKDAEFRLLISNKRQQIKLLNEQKQTVIDRAVTRGIDHKARLRPSGIEWLGDLPQHWKLRRLKYLVRNVNDQTEGKAPDEIYVALEHIESWTGRLRLPEIEVKFDSLVKRFKPGDILFGKLRPYLAKVGRPSVQGVCVGELLVLRPISDDILSEFLEYKLRSNSIINLITSSTFGAKMPRADWGFMGNMTIAFPPEKTEQWRIISSIQQQTTRFDYSISQALREIELIDEYRTSLTVDVVMGKRDVRGLKMPALQETSEPGLLEEETDKKGLEAPEELESVEGSFDADE
ncbi:MAG: restriction endonuclease subunit S [Candidatus Bathyarchaeia archaeon]|jgi:type I restriction enzyme S subunit